MTTAFTCQQRIQSASSSTPFLVVANVRVSLARRAGLRAEGTRIVAAMAALPMSMPHTRSRYSGSSVTSSTRLPPFLDGQRRAAPAWALVPPGEPGRVRRN
jgi:hypothetical protein